MNLGTTPHVGGRRLRAVLLLAPLAVVGCQPPAPAPPSPAGFLARSMQDCEHGDADACRMISALSPPPPKPPPPPTQTQRNVDAILQGMARARSAVRPTVTPSSPPVHATPPGDDISPPAPAGGVGDAPE